jgi:hypothetical protein
MKAAIVTQVNQTPVDDDFRDPAAQDRCELITVTASGLFPPTKARTAGTHYSSSGRFPMVVGVDGVGTTQSRRRVYFSMPTAPYGAMAEKTLANPGMSSVAALKTRADLRHGETVLVNGATGAAGTLAVQLAKHLGAGKVIATGRDVADSFAQQFSGDGVDVVLDYLYGQWAQTLLAAIGRTRGISRPIRYVSIGGVSAQGITLSSAARLYIDTTPVALTDVNQIWNTYTGKPRVVFVTH